MSFVEVIHLDVDAEAPQSSHPADAEDDLLRHPVLLGPAVEPFRDPPKSLPGTLQSVGTEGIAARWCAIS